VGKGGREEGSEGHQMAESVSSWKIGHGSRAYSGGGGGGVGSRGKTCFFKVRMLLKLKMQHLVNNTIS
jgi:hypothetical protein